MNWGKSIVLTFVLFACFIGYFVYQMTTNRVDLVRDDYYQDEIAFQQQIDRVSRTARLPAKPTLTYSPEQQRISVQIPMQWQEGSLTLYRPNNRDQDHTYPLQPSAAQPTVGVLEKGLWRMKLSWQANHQDYYYEQTLTIP